ncbi:MAG: PAS domain S-box protein, partial [Desulfobacterales bacterium]|nr:PAS domain S-box protein [Desulfobacterales bacterium]
MAQSKPIAQGIDITERKQAEEALRRSEERYRTIIENIQDGYYENDLAGNFTFVNDSMCRIFGYPKEELMGMNNRQYMDKENAKRLFQAFNRVYRTEEAGSVFVYEIIRKDGVRRNVETSFSIIKDALGKSIGFRGLVRDVTERKRMEDELRESEERYRTMLETMQEGYYEVDLSGNFTFVNDASCRHLGYTKEEMIGTKSKLYQDETTAEKMFQLCLDIYRTGEPITEIEAVWIKRDGTKGTYEASMSLIRDSKGNPIGFRGVSRNITERKKTEEALQQSEEKYRTILASIEDGYGELDLGGKLIFFNDALPRILGYPADELKNLHFNNRQYMDGENAERVRQAYTEVYATGKPNRGFQYEIMAQDGTRRYLECSVSLRKDADGQPVGFQGVVRDVTERKQAEERLRQSEERYRTILEGMQEAYYEIDLGGRFTFVNDAVCKHLGYPREELIGMDNRRFQDETTAKKTYQLYKEVYRTGEPAKALESEYIRKDGTKGTYEVSVSLIRDAHGKPIGFRGVSRDVTERKQAEEALRRSEERYRTIIENIQDGYFENDLAGNFTFANDSLCKSLGYTCDELIGMNHQQYTDKENAKKVFQAYNKIYTTGEPIKELDYEVIRKDGAKAFTEISVSLIRDSEGKLIGFRGISRDVTERKKAEEQLKRYAVELERSNEEIKNFAYIVSHDLRVPLVNLKGYTSELRTA